MIKNRTNRYHKMIISLVCTLLLGACGGNSAISKSASSSCASDDIPAASGSRWLAAWGTTRQPGDSAPVETTVRNIARITAGGSAVRLRFFNLDGSNSITIGAASLGIRDGETGAMLKSNSSVPVTFNCGQSQAVIPPNTESYYSDPVAIEVSNQDDLAVSLYIVGSDNPPEFGSAWNESYKLPDDSGDNTGDESGEGFTLIDDSVAQVVPGTPILCNGCSPYALRDIEVLTTEARGVMAFLGSSSFHGYNTSQNEYKRVSDLISVRIRDEFTFGDRHAVVNRGIGGDTLEAAYRDRITRDIWDTVGISSVVVWVTNDLSSRTAAEIISSYRQLIADAHSRDVYVFCPTWIPGAQSSVANITGERAIVNQWILDSGECDGNVDYNGAVEAPGGLTFLPQYNSGDSIHSNDAGHAVWSTITPLAQWINKSD